METNSEQRACRFHYENENGVYPLYAYSACTVRCRKKGQLDMCGCNDHFMLGTSKYIDLITTDDILWLNRQCFSQLYITRRIVLGKSFKAFLHFQMNQNAVTYQASHACINIRATWQLWGPNGPFVLVYRVIVFHRVMRQRLRSSRTALLRKCHYIILHYITYYYIRY